MKRVIKDFTNISDEHIMLIKSKYPRGFTDHDLVEFNTSNGGHFEALELRTDDAVYLVRVNHELLERIDEFEVNYDFSEED